MDYLPYIFAVVMGLFSAVFGLVCWLLANRDTKQQAEIATLFSLCDTSARESMQLRVQIANDHYKRAELDDRFKTISETIKDGFKELGADVKEMTKAVNENFKDHLKEYHSRE
jgi:uncharacterized protein YktB (UPF0637 family)